MDYHRTHNINIKIVRIFNTYSPNMLINDGRVISNFINQAINNKYITIYGDGTQTRSFQYIDDLVDALVKTMKTKDNFIGPLNLGNPHEISMNELASNILKLTNSKSQVKFYELPKDDPKGSCPDISLAKV